MMKAIMVMLSLGSDALHRHPAPRPSSTRTHQARHTLRPSKVTSLLLTRLSPLALDPPELPKVHSNDNNQHLHFPSWFVKQEHPHLIR